MPEPKPNPKSPLRVLIAAPRGFCAGVDCAIQIVELALERFGAPVYVRHEIVHNRFVVERLKGMGRHLRRRTGRSPGRPASGLFRARRAEVRSRPPHGTASLTTSTKPSPGLEGSSGRRSG